MLIKERYNQCVNSIVFKCFDNQCPQWNEAFIIAQESSLSLRNNHQKPKQPFCKFSICQKTLSFTGPALWNKIPEEIQRTTNQNTFKNNLKRNW